MSFMASASRAVFELASGHGDRTPWTK